MFLDTKDITKELHEFVNDKQFKNFEVIVENLAKAKILEMQGDKDNSADNLLANKKILNFYLHLPFTIKQFAKQAIENQKAKAEKNSDL